MSPPASWASIFLHVKAPDDGGCGPLPRARLARAAVRRRSGLEGQGLSGTGFFRRQRSSRELRFPPVSRARPSGPVEQGQRPSGRRPARFKGGSFGGLRRAGGTPANVRGRRTLPGAIRPAPETGLPCRSRFSEGRCRSRVDPHLSGKDGFPSPCWEAGRSGTARPPRWDGAKVSPAKESARQGADPVRAVPREGWLWRP